MSEFKIKAFDLHFSEKQVLTILLHVIGIATIGIVWSIITNNHIHRVFLIPIAIAAWVGVIIILFSLLDYLDIIKYRKTYDRFTKCIICDRTSKVNKFKDKTRVVTDIRKTGNDEDDAYDSEILTEKTITKDKPESPLHGIIIYDKMICLECSRQIKRMFEQ